jgi:transcriptional regulator with XRE-family HTH domain
MKPSERKLINIPFPLVEALKSLSPSELKELAEKARPFKTKPRSFRRTLERIRAQKTRKIRRSTLRRLQTHLKLLPINQERIKEIAQQIAQDKDLSTLYLFLLDAPRTGLRIHELLVERDWLPMDLSEAIHCIVCEGAGLKPKFDIKKIIKEAQSEEQLQKAVEKEIASYERDALLAREMGLLKQTIDTPRLEEIILGEDGPSLDELVMIARALGVPPEEIFRYQKHDKHEQHEQHDRHEQHEQSLGIKIFREVLAASSRKSKDADLNKLLNELRLLLGIRLD